MSNFTKIVASGASAVLLSFGFAGGAGAIPLDFTTATYAPTVDGLSVSDTVAGVNFVITPTARGADGFRQDGRGGLSFGVPGNGMYTISIVADQDLMYNSMTGIGHGFNQVGQLPFDIAVGGTEVSGDNMFAPAPHFSVAFETVSFAGGPISVAAGQTFLFGVDFVALAGSPVLASALVRSLDFSTSPGISPIPLPAGLPLLIGGIGALAVLRRKKQKKAA